jgi:AcrR family transcriptional regulator
MAVAATEGSQRRAPAWGADLPGGVDEARERLLEAAEACYAERGPSRTKMTHIANEAGVHRTTVYSYFPNRDAVLAACFVRANAVVLDAVESCWATEEPFIEQLVNACVVGLEAGRRSPTMRVLIGDDDLARTHRAAEESELWRTRLREALGQRFAAAGAAGEVRDDIAPDVMAHWVTRLCFSLLAEPGRPEYGGDEGLLRAFLPGSLAPQDHQGYRAKYSAGVDELKHHPVE